MNSVMVQRWSGGTDVWRPGDERINPKLFEVAPILDDTTAKAFVVAEHYSRTYPAARFRYGLYRLGVLVGVAVFSHPVNDKALAVFPGEPVESVELGRFVLLDSVPGNGESWFLARCFEQLRREGLNGVLSFSDPTPRMRADGTIIHAGHVGIIYQATGFLYLGLGTPRTLDVLPDGRVLNARSQQKIRSLDSRWESAARPLEENGAEPLLKAIAWRAPWLVREEMVPRETWDSPDPEALQRLAEYVLRHHPATAKSAACGWLEQSKAKLSRKLRHRGNHKYVKALRPAVARHLPKGLTYPRPPGGRATPKWGRRAPAAANA